MWVLLRHHPWVPGCPGSMSLGCKATSGPYTLAVLAEAQGDRVMVTCGWVEPPSSCSGFLHLRRPWDPVSSGPPRGMAHMDTFLYAPQTCLRAGDVQVWAVGVACP